MNFIRHCLTGKDNETYDIVRVLALMAVVEALALSVYVVVWKSAPFSLVEYGTGIGVIFASIGAALKLKESSEP